MHTETHITPVNYPLTSGIHQPKIYQWSDLTVFLTVVSLLCSLDTENILSLTCSFYVSCVYDYSQCQWRYKSLSSVFSHWTSKNHEIVLECFLRILSDVENRKTKFAEAKKKFFVLVKVTKFETKRKKKNSLRWKNTKKFGCLLLSIFNHCRTQVG